MVDWDRRTADGSSGSCLYYRHHRTTAGILHAARRAAAHKRKLHARTPQTLLKHDALTVLEPARRRTRHQWRRAHCALLYLAVTATRDARVTRAGIIRTDGSYTARYARKRAYIYNNICRGTNLHRLLPYFAYLLVKGDAASLAGARLQQPYTHAILPLSLPFTFRATTTLRSWSAQHEQPLPSTACNLKNL